MFYIKFLAYIGPHIQGYYISILTVKVNLIIARYRQEHIEMRGIKPSIENSYLKRTNVSTCIFVDMIQKKGKKLYFRGND